MSQFHGKRVVGVALVSVLSGIATSSNAALQFTDWTSINTSTDIATGSVGSIGVTLGGTTINGGVINGSFTSFSTANFSPSLALSDVVEFGATPTPGTFVVSFSQPVVNPVFHLQDMSTTITFVNATPTRVSGTASLTVAGNVVPCSNLLCHGTLSFQGTFSAITFTTPSVAGDGVNLQVGFDPLLAVPEPATVALLLCGLGAVAARVRARQ